MPQANSIPSASTNKPEETGSSTAKTPELRQNPAPSPEGVPGSLVWSRVKALAVAARALLAEQARPLLDELVGLAKAERGPLAEVVRLVSRTKTT